MTNKEHTHLVYLNKTVDEEKWSMYAPFCTEIEIQKKKYSVLPCSVADIAGIRHSQDLHVAVHTESPPISLKIPHSMILLIQDKTALGFTPEHSL